MWDSELSILCQSTKQEQREPKKGKRYGEAMEDNNTHTREIKLMFNIYSVVVFNNILHIQNLAFI